MKVQIRFLIVIAVVLLVCDMAHAQVGFSWDRAEGFFSFEHYQNCDSARVWMGTDSTNMYENTKVSPIDVTDSSTLVAYDLALDSTNAVHVVWVWYWPQGSTDSVRTDAWWYHSLFSRGTPQAPSGSSICRIYGHLSDLGAEYVDHALVTANMTKKKVIDTCANTLIFDRTVEAEPSNDTGYFFIDLIYSSCLQGTKYKLTVSKHGLQDITQDITVPDSATYFIVWKD